MGAMNLTFALARRQPDALPALRQTFPSQAEVFREGKDMGHRPVSGHKDIGPRPISGQTETAAIIALVEAAIPALRADCNDILVGLGGRLRLAGRLRTIGAIVSAVSAAGLLPALQYSEKAVQAGLAVIAFLASTLSILADKIAAAGSKGSVEDLFKDVAAKSAALLRIELRIRANSAIPVSKTEALELQSQADEVAYWLHQVAIRLKVL